MRRAKLFVICLLLIDGGMSAHGQAKPAGVGPGTSITIGGGVADMHLQYGQRWLRGAHVWSDLTLHKYYSLEFAYTRMDHNQDEHVHASTFMIGPRVSFTRRNLDPFVKVMAGRGYFNFPFDYAQGRYFVYSVGGGIDLHAGRRWTIRVADFEYQKWPQFTFGSMSTYGVSAGISYTLYRGPTWNSD